MYFKLCIPVLLLFQYYSSALAFSNVSIIVVGAGPSGIAAATRLVEHNFSNVMILEAENRIGQYKCMQYCLLVLVFLHIHRTFIKILLSFKKISIFNSKYRDAELF